MKKIFALSAALMVFLNLSGCKKVEKNSINFTASCYPVYIIALNITKGISGVKVNNMAKNHSGCLHNFQIQSEDLKNIEQSSAFIINGAGMEPFLSKITEELPGLKIIDSSEGIDLIEDDDCLDDHCSDDECESCHHHEYNPHIWMSITNYIKQVENITKGIENADPVHSKEYSYNAQEYIQKLENLKDKMHSELSGFKDKSIVTFHEAFPYFAEEFGINIAGVITHEPGSEPNPKELAEIIALIKESGIKHLFTEPQYSNASALTIAAETGAEIYTLDPAVTGDSSADSYINIMNNNLKTLREALSG